MNMLFKNNYIIKIRKYDRKIHKSVRIPVDVYQVNKKLCVIVKPKHACKLEFEDHFWLPFIDQPQPDIIVFAIINLRIYNILVHKWKHGIGPNDIILSNEES